MTPNHIPALLIIAAFVAAWPAGAATADDHFGPAAERGALFEEFVETIRKHSYINKSGLKKLGTEWQAELNKSKRRFLNAKTSQQAYYAIVSLKNSTHDFHSLLGSGPPPDDTKDLERYVRYVPNLFDVKLLERRIEGLQIVPAYRKKSTEVEFVVSEGVAGVPPGSVLVSIDGIQGIEDFEGYDDRAVPVSELRKHYYQWFSRGSSRYALDQGFATWLTARHSKLNPVPTDGDVHTYRFRSGGQKEIELKAKWLDFNPDKSSGWHPICTPCKEVKEYQDPDRFKLVFRGLNYCIYRPLNVRENVAIVHMFTFDYPDGNEPLKNCCEKKKHDLPKNPIIGWRETDHRALVLTCESKAFNCKMSVWQDRQR